MFGTAKIGWATWTWSRFKGDNKERAAKADADYASIKPSMFPSVTDVTSQQLKDGMESDPESWVTVDVRPSVETDVSVIVGALTIEQFESQYTRTTDGPDDAPLLHLVAYCTVGVRSGIWAEKWISEGKTKGTFVKRNEDNKVFKVEAGNLVSSLAGWTATGGKLVDASGEGTTKVHGFSKAWSNSLSTDFDVVC